MQYLLTQEEFDNLKTGCGKKFDLFINKLLELYKDNGGNKLTLLKDRLKYPEFNKFLDELQILINESIKEQHSNEPH